MWHHKVLFLCLALLESARSLHQLRTSSGALRPTISRLQVDKPILSHERFNYKHALSIRGGKSKKKKPKEIVETDAIEEEEGEFDISEKFRDLKGLLPSFDISEIAAKNRFTKQALDTWTDTPPFTQVYLGSSILITLIAFLLNGNQWPAIFDVDWVRIFSRLKIWRLVTGFLYLGPLGLNYMLTLHFLWTYMGDLEKANAANPEEFFVALGFGGGALLLCYLSLGISSRFIGHNLATYLVYLWSRSNEGSSINMMDLFVIQAELIPWFFCLQALIMDGEFPTADVIGIIIGHMYSYYMKIGSLRVPKGTQHLIPASFRERYAKLATKRKMEQEFVESEEDL